MKTTSNNHQTATIFVTATEKFPSSQGNQSLTKVFQFLQPLRQLLDKIEIHNPRIARFIASLIPAQCPFERDFSLFGHKIAHIPPLCKLNPFYEQLVGLRFRALCFLADECGEDIQSYC